MDTYLCDIIVGLQNGFEGKTKAGINILKNNMYDLCIKVNGGVKNTPIIYNGKKIYLKEIPYSILFGINTLISNSCIINLNNLLDDINVLKSLNISLEKLYISTNAHIIQLQHINENKRNGNRDTCFPTYRDKYNKQGLEYGNLDYLEIVKYLDGNIISKVDSIDIINNAKKILMYQFYSFNYDIDWGQYNKSKGIHASAGFCCSLVSPGMINNIYGICSIYDIFVDINETIIECDYLNMIENIENQNSSKQTMRCNWLNLDNLIRALKINNINILIFTRCDTLINIHKYKLFHKNKLLDFKNWKNFSKYLTVEINKLMSINDINYSYSKINL
jgi:adenylosuccinate synthase